MPPLARKGEELEYDLQHNLPSACAFHLLPRVLYGNPALRYRWEGLFSRIERPFCNQICDWGLRATFLIDTVREGLLALNTNPRAILSIMSGCTDRKT